MLTRSSAREILTALVQAVQAGDAEDRQRGADSLSSLSGRDWLQLDDVARGPGYLPAVVAGARGWLGPASREPSGFVAVVASFHVDGRIRERATLLLAEQPGALRSAAIALRCLDHVPQVRDAARQALASRRPPTDAAAVISVLIAGAGRLAGPSVLAEYIDRLLAEDASRTLAALRDSSDRDVHRWALQTALDRGLLTSDEVLLTAMRDRDQVVRARFCAWIGSAGTTTQLRALLEARSPDGKVVALQHLPDQDLSTEQLQACLLDRSGRVRDMAQWRAKRRDLDLAKIYRRALVDNTNRSAPALAGLAAFGTSADVALIQPYRQDPRPAVRAAAIAALTALLPAAEARPLLENALHDVSPRVAAAAARALQRVGASAETIDAAWQSNQLWSRKAAWRLQRATGGWGRVHADLRASHDAEPELAGTGRAGLRNWLVNGAAATWNQPSAQQKVLFQQLLPTSGLDPDARRVLAFHAGLLAEPPEPRRPELEAPTEGEAPEGQSLRERLRRAWGRKA